MQKEPVVGLRWGGAIGTCCGSEVGWCNRNLLWV